MKFNGEQYFRASVERMRQAREIHNSRRGYALAMYAGGLAVECMLRAFRWVKDKEFEGRHDLEDLLKASHFLSINEQRLRDKNVSEKELQEAGVVIRAAMNDVVVLWHNNLRLRVGK